MIVPFYDLNPIHKSIKNEIMEAISGIIDTGSFIQGKQVADFEAAFARYCNSKYCIGVGNGLDALKIALQTLNIGPGDEVIVPAHTYIATWLAVSELGAVPVPVDANPDTMNLDPNLVEPCITSKTKAIIPVHLYGLPCEMDAITKLAKAHHLHIVEDFAQAQGASFANQAVGSFGILNGTSFYPSKNIGAMGDAGAITTSDAELFQKAAMLKNYGSQKRYFHEIQGVNSRLDTFQAAILNIKLKELSAHNLERKKLANQYQEKLGMHPKIKLQTIPQACESVYHLFVIRVEKRDLLQQYLDQQGIGSLIHYPCPPHLQKAYHHLQLKPGAFPVAEQIASEALSLPLYVGMSTSEVDYVSHAVLSFLDNH